MTTTILIPTAAMFVCRRPNALTSRNPPPNNLPELDSRVGLVRGLVFGEPGVAMDTERLGDRIGRIDLGQAGREIRGELEKRALHVLFVPGLVGVEPRALIVEFQLHQELEELPGEELLLGDGHVPCP